MLADSKEVLKVKLPTVWTDENRGGKSQRREEKRRRKKIKKEKVSEERRSEVREKAAKSRNTVFFPMICGSGRSKSRLAKAAGAEER